MGYIATCLGNFPEINASPITNNLSNLGIAINGQSTTSQNNFLLMNKIRESLLTILLPEPMVMPKIDEIVKFKTKYKNQLVKCRNVIEESCTDIFQNKDRSMMLEKKYLIKEKINNEVEEINDAMKSEWQKTIFKVLIPFTIAELSCITANPVAMAIGGLSLIQALYSGMELYQDHISLNNKPLAYIAQARRLFYNSKPLSKA